MTPDNEVKDDSAIDKPAAIELKAGVATFGLVVVLGLIVTAGVMVGILVKSEPVAAIKAPTIVPSTTRIVSSQDLEAYTLLTEGHLIVLQGKDDTSDEKKKELVGRYLLTKVTLGAEIKPDMLAPAEPKGLLDNSVAVTIPATATTSLGDQLRVGDMVDLFLVHDNQSPTNQPDQSKPLFENLLVLNLPIKKVDDKSPAQPPAITLALPTNKRNEFLRALPGATIVLTRKVSTR